MGTLSPLRKTSTAPAAWAGEGSDARGTTARTRSEALRIARRGRGMCPPFRQNLKDFFPTALLLPAVPDTVLVVVQEARGSSPRPRVTVPHGIRGSPKISKSRLKEKPASMPSLPIKTFVVQFV